MIGKLKEFCWAFLAIAQFVYIILRGRIQASEARATVEELKRKYAENKLAVEKENAGKSSDDIIDEHLKR